MSKFDELKKAAEAAIEREDCDRFIQRDDAQAVLDLLAIQAQMVAALKAAKTWHNGEKWRDSSDPSEVRAWEQHRDIISAALSAAGAQP